MKLKTDLLNPKNFNRTQFELEEFLLLCAFVAGKSSKQQYHKLELFLDLLDLSNGIFEALSKLSITEIKEKLIQVKTGQYGRLSSCLFVLSRKNLNLSTCSCEDLEAIPGIGMKTSRFFITYSRPKSMCAILDTHILSYLRFYYPDAPKATPSNKKQYLKWENLFLAQCFLRGMEPNELDIEIWKTYQKSWTL